MGLGVVAWSDRLEFIITILLVYYSYSYSKMSCYSPKSTVPKLTYKVHISIPQIERKGIESKSLEIDHELYRVAG